MNTALALEIYRGLWVVESSRVDALKNVLRDAKAGAIYDPKDRLNTFAFYNIKTGLTVPAKTVENNSQNEKRIAITDINGVITKSGGASSRGMESISKKMIDADNDPNVIGHFVRVDSPGGSAAGMKYMQITMQSLTKPKVTMVTRQGMAASGGWGILSEGDYVMAESADASVGCHGVMWSVSGVPNGQKDAGGEVNFTVISVTSPNKNESTERAINNNDTSLMQAEVDKLHLEFQASTRAARPNIKEDQMTGAMYPASEVVGTMIDAIGTQKEGLNKILELSKSKLNFIPHNSNTKKVMKSEEYKTQHPEEYAKVFDAGVTAERDRVDTWMVYHDIDPVAVQKGIESGKAVSNKEMAAFNLKASMGAGLQALRKDSAGNIIPPEAETIIETPKTAKQIADEAEFKATFPDLVAKGITLEKMNSTIKSN